MTVLTVNAGSSSIRLAMMERAGTAFDRRAAFHGRQVVAEAETVLRDFLAGQPAAAVQAIAHRIVHGAEQLVQPCLITEAIEAEIARLAPLAPLHNPAALACIRACRTVLGKNVPQVAVCDTAFYAELLQTACRYALPRT